MAQACSNSISLFFHFLDSSEPQKLAELFEEDGVLFVRTAGGTFLYSGRAAIAEWAEGIQKKFAGATHWESNVVITKNEDGLFMNQSYWQSREGEKILSYGTHKDVFLVDGDTACFRYRSVDVTWTPNGHASLPKEETFASNLFQAKLKWTQVWSDISNDNMKWKKGESSAAPAQLQILEQHGITKKSPLRVFAPLCGDAPLLNVLFQRGDSVVGVDCSMSALQSLFKRVGDSIPVERSVTTLKTPSGTAKVPSLVSKGSNGGKLQGICSDVFFELTDQDEFDLVFDKDALGALHYDLHADYITMIRNRLSKEGFVYLEAKYREDGDKELVPPFHITKEYVQSLYSGFELLEVKENPFGDHFGPKMKHIAYLLQKQ